ncbi:TerD family protein [Methylicorpusculum oleiharenae]|jgi:tellurium resistance protein TerD|uniref:TerD family protein n=1 Tax=Methylicorpusculum oleiharenae TaxID=1338687 RepID=UPI00135C94EC|nr:TerD family protein [Methylicorpusculum oleiharenae]MCD2452863.1 TerD family protein [Methylicorpusculum oleiharenae]
MAISLSKGGNISLTKTDPQLKNIHVGLSWDARSTDGSDFDLDASVFLVKSDNKVRGDHDFIFYNQLKSSCGSVEHTGDNRTGAGDGDDEVVKVMLDKVPQEISKIVVVVTIHDAESKGQNFGQVHNAAIRLVNMDTNIEVTRYDLSEDASIETAMIFGEIYRHNTEWKFKAVGQGYSGGLRTLALQHGIQL